MNGSRDLPGFKVDAVEAWIASNVAGLTPPLEWKQLCGGHSNLTCRLKDKSDRYAVIRRPPEGKLLPRAHDMAREWAIVSALSQTAVPAARPIAFCEAPEITGAHFYIMSAVDGIAMHNRQDVEKHLLVQQRRKAAFALIEALSQLHMVDPDTVGLGSFAKRSGYIERQIRAWGNSWVSAAEIDGDDDPRGGFIKNYLEASIPALQRESIVHGDFGFHNVLLGSDFSINAILDWEIATLGDPLADLAYVLNVFQDGGPEDEISPNAIGAASGFPTRSELANHYAQQTGASLTNLRYYTIFNLWKSASIIKGVCARYQVGAKSSDGIDLAELKYRIESALSIADRMVQDAQ